MSQCWVVPSASTPNAPQAAAGSKLRCLAHRVCQVRAGGGRARGDHDAEVGRLGGRLDDVFGQHVAANVQQALYRVRGRHRPAARA